MCCTQVRFASSVATRTFLTKLSAVREKYFSSLIPRMALNRYYVAEGVKLYSQATWVMVVGTEGPAIVSRYIDEVVEHYVSQTDADNHAVREAACACIAELPHKVPRDDLCVHCRCVYYVLTRPCSLLPCVLSVC
jgi:hypothetical protein